MNGETLECSAIVLRAVLRAKNIDRAAKKVLAGAFLLRTFPDGTREAGLSVSFNLSPAEAAAQFSKCHGIASLHVGRVRTLELDVVPDEPNHANILTLPHPADDPARAEYFASRLQEQARLVP